MKINKQGSALYFEDLRAGTEVSLVMPAYNVRDMRAHY